MYVQWPCSWITICPNSMNIHVQWHSQKFFPGENLANITSSPHWREFNLMNYFSCMSIWKIWEPLLHWQNLIPYCNAITAKLGKISVLHKWKFSATQYHNLVKVSPAWFVLFANLLALHSIAWALQWAISITWGHDRWNSDRHTVQTANPTDALHQVHMHNVCSHRIHHNVTTLYKCLVWVLGTTHL